MNPFSLLLRFHRFVISVLLAAAAFRSSRRIGLAALAFVCTWVALFLIRQVLGRIAERRNLRTHAEPFRKMFGPYGQKIIRAAQEDRAIGRKLNEVFSPRRVRVEEAVKHLQLMNELARLGMRSTDTAAEAEDLALAYGKSRLEKNDFAAPSSLRIWLSRRKTR